MNPRGPGLCHLLAFSLCASQQVATCPSSGHAATTYWTTNGTGVCTAPLYQYIPMIVSDGSGGAIMSWLDGRDGGSTYRVFAQRLLTDGSIAPGWTPNGSDLCAGHGVDASQFFSIFTTFDRLASDGAGGAVVTWWDKRSGGADIYAQRVTANGATAAGWPDGGLAVCKVGGDQLRPHTISDGVGGLFIVWEDFAVGPAYLWGQHLMMNGTIATGWIPDGFSLINAPTGQTSPSMAADGAGGMILSWQDARAGIGNADIYALRIDPDGNPHAGWPVTGFPVCTAAGNQLLPLTSSDGAGGAFITWRDDRGEVDTYALRLTAAGAVAPGWAADGMGAATGAGAQVPTDLLADGVGGAYLAWADQPSGGSRVIRLTADGGVSAGWPASGVGVLSSAIGTGPAELVPDGAGGVIAVWAGSLATSQVIRAQRITSSGALATGWPADGTILCEAPASPAYPASAPDGAGGVIVAWDDRRGGESDIYAGRIGDDGLVPTLIAFVRAAFEPGRVMLTWWDGGAERARDLEVERSDDGTRWRTIGSASSDGTSQVTYADATIQSGARYGYRLAAAGPGGRVLYGETWIEVPRGPSLALHDVRPNPASQGVEASFAVPTSGPAFLAVLDVSGRLRLSKRVDFDGPGSRTLRLIGPNELPPGAYTVRLTQRGRAISRRVMIIR